MVSVSSKNGGDKGQWKLSETRRLQNKLSQKRWRERRKAEKSQKITTTVEKECGLDGEKVEVYNKEDEKNLQPSLQINQTNFLRSYETRNEGVNASDMIDALALPNEEGKLDDGKRRSKEVDENDSFLTTSDRQINPQRLTLSQLLSLAYCSPAFSFQPFLQSIHFVKMFVQNSNRFNFDLHFIGVPKSESYIAQDWFRYLRISREEEEQGKSTRHHHHQSSSTSPYILSDIAPLTPSTSTRTTNESNSIHSNSPINQNSPNLTHLQRPLRWDRIPDNMHPTQEQLLIKHHPYIDVSFPWPSMRSKLIKMLYSHNGGIGMIDYNDFCDACFKAGLPGSEIKQPAFYIWSDDSMDPFAWEVGEEFAKKWWFLLDDEIIKRTNWWRRLRGLSQIVGNGKQNGRNDSMKEEWIT